MTAITIGRLRKIPVVAKTSVKRVELKGLVILAICVIYTILLLAVTSTIEALFIFVRYFILGKKTSSDTQPKPSLTKTPVKTSFETLDTNNNVQDSYSKSYKQQQIHVKDYVATTKSQPKVTGAVSPPYLYNSYCNAATNQTAPIQKRHGQILRFMPSSTTTAG